MTDGTAKYNASHYRISVYYDLAKVAVEPAGLLSGPRTGEGAGHDKRWPSPPAGCGRR